MRNKLVKLLRSLEKESGFENSYSDRLGDEECDYSVTEYLDFPNYRVVIGRFNKKYPLPKNNGLQPIHSSNSIKAELKRMEMDGILDISIQKGTIYAHTESSCGPDYEGTSFETESIILTTRGKSSWQYFVHEAMKNPLSTLLSIVALIISIIALFYNPA